MVPNMNSQNPVTSTSVVKTMARPADKKVSCTAQEQKKKIGVAPVVFLGDVPVSQRQILYNAFLGKLTKSYQLVSRERFEKAQETVFQALDTTQCTEEKCIRRVQEILQIEDIFFLQLIREERDTQITVTRFKNENRIVAVDFCESCNTRKLNSRILGLVEKILVK